MRTECDRNGFTLLEMMVTVIIVGIVAAIALPSYGKARERGYRRHAEQALLTIYHGERAYFLSNDGRYYDVVEGGGMTEWRKINMDNPNLGSILVTFSVTTPTATTFTATATRDASRSMTINQDRQWCGACADASPCATCTWQP